MKWLFFAVILTGCAQIQISEPLICDSRDITFPGVIVQPVSVMQSFSIPTGIAADWLSNVTLTNGQITSTTDLSFLTDLTISVANTNGPDFVLWDAHNPKSMVLPVAPSNKNLVKLIDANSNITLNIIAAGQLPSNDWSLNVSLCMSAEVRKDYGL